MVVEWKKFRMINRVHVCMLLYLLHIHIEHKNMHLTGKMRKFLRCENMFGWSSEPQRAVWGVRHGLSGGVGGFRWLLLGAGEHIMSVKVLTQVISTKVCVYLERLVIITPSSWMLTSPQTNTETFEFCPAKEEETYQWCDQHSFYTFVNDFCVSQETPAHLKQGHGEPLAI